VNYLGVSAPAPNKPAFSSKCLIAMGQYGAGTMEAPIVYTIDKVPAAPCSTSTRRQQVRTRS